MINSKPWEWEINNKTSYVGTPIAELWSFRHLLASFVRRDFLVNYQQTILGPVWMFLQPMLTLLTYVLIFGRLVGLSTGTLPPVLFYFSGIILWNFFSDSLTGTSNTFRDHAHIFSKVYFPRLIVPLATICTHLIRFSIQLFLFLLIVGYFIFFKGFEPTSSSWFIMFPVAVVSVGAMSLGLGLILSTITAKYRDMAALVNLGIRLMMFATPVIYPVTSLPQSVHWIIQLNPLTPLFEFFRFSLLGEGVVNANHLTYSLVFSLAMLTMALLQFNKKADTLIDVV